MLMSVKNMTGRVLSNDGDRAEVILSNGERLHINRRDPLTEEVSCEQFLDDLPVGEIDQTFLIERFWPN